MRCAVVDIGSNTTRLLVADVVGALPREILAHKTHTHLGRALRAGEDVTAAVAAGVAEQVAAARGAGAERLRVVATAAVRDARGGAGLCAAIEAAAGVPVEVLPCEEEARLAFRGATATAPPATGGDGAAPAGGARVAVVDVGGGSTELAIGTAGGGVEWCVSVPTGSGALTDAHLRSDPPAAAELAVVRAAVERALRAVDPPAATRALAVGGSAASLASIAGGRLDAAAVATAVATLTGAPAAEVARRTGLEAERVRLLPAGLLLLAALAGRLDLPLELGCGGLREGVCLELAA